MTPVQQIRQHALENYNNGWDYIVECYTDEEIQADYLDECNGDLEAALKLIEDVASIRKDRQEEAQKYIEENKDTQLTEQHNMTTTFNGWTNRETWQANLWLDNDGIFEMFREDREAVTPERLESFLEELLHEHTGQGSLLGDIVTDWMSSVNFDEIAANVNEE